MSLVIVCECLQFSSLMKTQRARLEEFKLEPYLRPRLSLLLICGQRKGHVRYGLYYKATYLTY